MNASAWVMLLCGCPTAASVLWSALAYLPKRLRGIDNRTASIETRVAFVEAEHRNNGGSSMRDAIDRIERSQHATRDDVKDLSSRLNDHLIDAARQHAALETQVQLLQRGR